ncbi:hypothetical protein, partial [Sporosarcina newyorkensis]|uniref:hypothetical protein n=1 Tax=Sporosarcina newyorkensis TaxID=759851 RepID=UPI001C0A8693
MGINIFHESNAPNMYTTAPIERISERNEPSDEPKLPHTEPKTAGTERIRDTTAPMLLLQSISL